MGIDLGSPPQVPDHTLGVSLFSRLFEPVLNRLAHAFTLVGNFHTHPLSSAHLGNSHPSRNDLLNAYDRQVPGIIVGRDGMIKYGDARRDMTNPGGYPPKPSRAQEGAYPTRKIGPRPNAAPNDVNPHDN
ncbi:hypothetical protein BOTBODRAFT_563640 [Botryobasidium botryosum FD-172 SS1]|uniref:JAB domain-containing protein n=1 Tax=Botryobasidium botryosum (strain FD-172 SS1) TaxID=930990 RepID=A0A067LYL7_BOTB1|nr:hypothetical protein BOTBODRAFT_563640 [Botryobasidium botryosum FD-172 SS1]